MDTKPLVSICIPVYNRPELVKRALDSCIKQTYQNIEVVVVDDASTDNTFEVVQSYAARDPRVRAYRNEKNLGMVPNWKRTFELATGEYVQHLGSDDALSHAFVERKVAIFEKYTNAAFVACGIRNCIANGGGSEEILNETKYPAGKYDTSYVLKNFYKMPALISTACTVRRGDMLKHFTVTVPNEWGYDDAYRKAGKIMDNMVFLSVLADYDYMYYLNDVFYESLEHPGNATKLFVGLTRGNIGDHIKFVHIDQVGFTYFYKMNAPAYLSRFQVFIGADVLANTILDLILGRAKGDPRQALKYFFRDYRTKEKILTAIHLPFRLIKRGLEWIGRKL